MLCLKKDSFGLTRNLLWFIHDKTSREWDEKPSLRGETTKSESFHQLKNASYS